ncbi:dUTPase family protein [Synechococcus sp. SYN20]|uniref:dCTP deaminase n=1 Tax=Synechococcus sp. SYN20 TaxID=1050714 RepID=UPI001648A477|nr:dCTP deaminase [Synechococcus sp. SYN20]QNJ25889.1 dUTPase family protein [Synechococcus sp. SYN20]
MSTLVDHQIRNLARSADAIQPYSEEQLNPASYNLRIGTKGIIETPRGRRTVDLTNGFKVVPGGWILTDVEELISIPSDVEAQVILRSSAARRGWDHALAGYVDPGYEGRLTLEFVNCLKYEHLTIQTGMQMVQLKLSGLDALPERDYSLTGRYSGATEVEDCKDSTL